MDNGQWTVNSLQLTVDRKNSMMKQSIIGNKSFEFAVRVVRLCRHLNESKKEFVLTKQLLRSGTSIGANVSEGTQGMSAKDFQHKLSIALKEAEETMFWLRLLHATDFLSPNEFESISVDCKELCKLLTAILKTSRSNNP